MKRALLEMLGESQGGSYEKWGDVESGIEFTFKSRGGKFQKLHNPNPLWIEGTVDRIKKQTKARNLKVSVKPREVTLSGNNVDADTAEDVIAIIADEEWGFTNAYWGERERPQFTVTLNSRIE